MDTSHYAPNGMNASDAQYMVSSHQLQQPQPPHTLPPLQPQHAAMNNIYGTASTPRASGPRSTTGAGATTAAGTYTQMPPLPRNFYSHHQQPQYGAPPVTQMQQTQMNGSNPAPNRISHQQPIRPMPMSAAYGQNGLLAQSPILQHENDQPTHVVGSQGRRGILPTAPGKAAITTTAGGIPKAAVIPAKDADGKFPCPHCTKTYLHAKHLKRHLLRRKHPSTSTLPWLIWADTGDRPYMCVLCKDTFSRSDILKRHFQKCSIRRGNPTGASHLSHAQEHLKKPRPAHKSTSSISSETLMNLNGLSGMSHDPNMNYGVVTQANGDHLPPGQGISRSNSLKDSSSAMTSQNVSAHNSTRSSIDQGYVSGIPHSMSSALNSALAYNMPNGQGVASYGQTYDFSAPPNNAAHGTGQAHDTTTASGPRANMASVYANNAANQQQQGVDWSMFHQAGHATGQNNFLNTYSTNVAEAQMPGVK